MRVSAQADGTRRRAGSAGGWATQESWPAFASAIFDAHWDFEQAIEGVDAESKAATSGAGRPAKGGVAGQGGRYTGVEEVGEASDAGARRLRESGAGQGREEASEVADAEGSAALGIDKHILGAFNSVLAAFSRQGDNDGTGRVVEMLVEAGLQPNAPTFHTLVRGAADKDMPLGVEAELFGRMKSAGVAPTIQTRNAILGEKARVGGVTECVAWWKHFEAEGWNPNVNSWNILLMAHAKDRDCRAVWAVFADMEKSGCAPDEGTWVAMITSHGRKVRKGNSMADARVVQVLPPPLLVWLPHAPCALPACLSTAVCVYTRARVHACGFRWPAATTVRVLLLGCLSILTAWRGVRLRI